jgi:hypothetical protein
MNRNFTFPLLTIIILFAGCSKDFLKQYEDRIVGTWEITDIDRIGFSGNTSRLPFRDGTFTFLDNGTLTYVNAANATFTGTWEIIKKVINDETVQSLEVTAVDFTNQVVLAEHYDDMNFSGTNHFKAHIYYSGSTYVTHFRR